MHPAKSHIAAVLGGRQGSGYLLGPRLVLTAAHVVSPDTETHVIVPGKSRPVRCQTIWSAYEKDVDAALLLAESELYEPPQRQSEVEPVTLGRLEGLQAWPGAHAIGYPDVQRDQDGNMDTDQITGVLKPGSGILRGTYALDVAHVVPTPRDGLTSPWAGLSGAPLFIESALVGIVRADQNGWRNSRILVTPISKILDDANFQEACEIQRCVTRNRNLIPARAEENGFERHYRNFVISQHSELTIIGLSQGSNQEVWPLETSYLSLELLEESRSAREFGSRSKIDASHSTEELSRTPQRAEHALAGRYRVLIRGEAGSGKTTMLQWLATSTARGDLPESLADFADYVPILLKLRTFVHREELPTPEDFLSIAAKPLAGLPGAQGWVTRQLSNGRALLLIDGVDEVAEGDRDRTRNWLAEIMAAFPDSRYVITTRPSAVREGWLSNTHFAEFELLPMGRSDVFAFIDKWHEAVASTMTYQYENLLQLEDWRSILRRAILAKPGLSQLATSPLMCALICALNRDRRGYLPEGRMELYAAALEMLLIRRDKERGVATSEELQPLRLEEQVQLLQRLAFWLTINGASEISYASAVKTIFSALPALPSIKGSAEQILTYLIERSGLLRQPTTDTIDFVHRTFQDYLAAMAAIEDDNFGVLINNAHDDQWADLFRMAVGHARPKERVTLLCGVLDRAKAEIKYRKRLRLIAAASLEHATALDPTVRNSVQSAISRLIPPRDEKAAKALARTGPIIMDLLPGPQGLSGKVREAVLTAATTVGGEQAIPLLARYAEHATKSEYRVLAGAWDRFDTQEYWHQVLSLLPNEDVTYVVKTVEQLSLLTDSTAPRSIDIVGNIPATHLTLIPKENLRKISFREHRVSEAFSFLADFTELKEVELWNCDGRLDLVNLRHGKIERLSMFSDMEIVNFNAIGDMQELRLLTMELGSGRVEWAEDFDLPPALTWLRAPSLPLPDSAVRSIAACRHLGHICFNAEVIPPPARRQWAQLASLERIEVGGEGLASLAESVPLPQVEGLWLGSCTELDQLHQVARIYPNLKELIFYLGDFTDRPPLELLSGLKGCQVKWRSSLERLEGADAWGWFNCEIP
ncbi:NACHT domain-containing protein [Streptomyces sp. NPDC058251]|uniref:NACHT domain-containing protein n=2 Tax=unclassified Streptomyces TaxID=2593676 RepID=UPI0036EC93BB